MSAEKLHSIDDMPGKDIQKTFSILSDLDTEGLAQSISDEEALLIAQCLINHSGGDFIAEAKRMYQNIIPRQVLGYAPFCWILVYFRYLAVLAWMTPQRIAHMFPSGKWATDLVYSSPEDILAKFGKESFGGNVYRVQDFLIEFPNTTLCELVFTFLFRLKSVGIDRAPVVKAPFFPKDVREFLGVYRDYGRDIDESLADIAEGMEKDADQQEQAIPDNVVSLADFRKTK